MLSHDNVSLLFLLGKLVYNVSQLTWVTESLRSALGKDQWQFGRDRIVSYLPLSHIAATVHSRYTLKFCCRQLIIGNRYVLGCLSWS